MTTGGSVFRQLLASAALITLAFSSVQTGTAGAALPRANRRPAGGFLSVKTDTTTPAAVTLDGAGANSIEPFFAPVFYDYQHKNPKTTINYNPAGSSVGITDIEQETVNFGDSEIPMNELELDQAKDPAILQVPVDLGGVAISVNLPGVTKRLDLDGPTLAGIFDGSITKWNSPQIASVTGISNLPSLPIIPVHRADSSGPSYDLDEYLFKTAPAWAAAVKTTTPSRSWPLPKVGVGEQLNTGVATYIKQTPGSIGYLEYSYALESGFSCAAIKNRSGDFVTPSEKSIAAAGAQNGRLTPSNYSIIYEPGATTYPIANFSWTLVIREQPTTATGIALGKLLYYVVTQGQKLAGKLGYAPLPTNVSAYAIRTIERLEGPSGTPLFSSS
jgi:phosphate transport system substrate-binding protein